MQNNSGLIVVKNFKENLIKKKIEKSVYWTVIGEKRYPEYSFIFQFFPDKQTVGWNCGGGWGKVKERKEKCFCLDTHKWTDKPLSN